VHSSVARALRTDAVLFALSTGQKTGLAVVAGSFIVFALISALLVPRLSPDFPGSRGLRWFVVATLVFTAGTLSAVVFLAAETKEKSEAATTPTSGTTTTGASVPKGNPASGKQLFTSAGCVACHTFTPAGSKGTIGPDLDNLAANAQKANRGSVEQYAFESIKSPDAYTVPGYAKGTMAAAIPKLTDAQIADLVAFLTQKK
jgi:mono/diheme cytochrome c family protein